MSLWKFIKYAWKNSDRMYYEFLEEEQFKKNMERTEEVLSKQVEAERKRENINNKRDLENVVVLNKKLTPKDISDSIPGKNIEPCNWVDRFYTKEEQEEFKKLEANKKSEWIKKEIRQAAEDKEVTKKVTEEGWMDKLIATETPREPIDAQGKRIVEKYKQ